MECKEVCSIPACCSSYGRNQQKFDMTHHLNLNLWNSELVSMQYESVSYGVLSQIIHHHMDTYGECQQTRNVEPRLI